MAFRLRGVAAKMTREKGLRVHSSARQLTVLGSCGAFPEPGRACSGFAIDWDGYRLVLDLGYATLPRLLAHWPHGTVDAGRQAGTRRLMLTHFWPGNDRAASIATATAEFGAPVLAATEGLTIQFES